MSRPSTHAHLLVMAVLFHIFCLFCAFSLSCSGSRNGETSETNFVDEMMATYNKTPASSPHVISPHIQPDERDGILVQNLEVHGQARRHGVSGILLTFHHHAGSTDFSGDIRFKTIVRRTSGLPLSTAVTEGNIEQKGKNLLVTHPTRTYSDQISEEIFVPYYSMKLYPGNHMLNGQISAERIKRSKSAKKQWESVKVIGDDRFKIKIKMPQTHKVRLKIKSITVKRGDYDSITDIKKTYKAVTHKELNVKGGMERPDLFWEISRGNHRIFQSTVKRDTFRGTWKNYTPWFRIAEGDQVSLTVIDSDLIVNDKLANFMLTVDEYNKLAKSNKALSSGNVTSVTQYPPQVRKSR